MKRRVLHAALALGLAGGSAAAAPLELWLEPVQASALVLGPLYTKTAGVDGRSTAHLGLGAAVGWKSWQGAVTFGRAARHTDFGLLEGPRVRLERADVLTEVRWRAPLELQGFGFQAAAGLGRLLLRYHPDRVVFSAGGETFEVALGETAAWTRQVAAEVLHDLPGNAWIALRTSWIFYAMDVATPSGTERRDVRDVQAGVALRVRLR